jgi:hypothetical protein
MIGAIFVVEEKGREFNPLDPQVTSKLKHQLSAQEASQNVLSGTRVKSGSHINVTLLSRVYKYLWILKLNCLFLLWELKECSQSQLKNPSITEINDLERETQNQSVLKASCRRMVFPKCFVT